MLISTKMNLINYDNNKLMGRLDSETNPSIVLNVRQGALFQKHHCQLSTAEFPTAK